MSKLYTTAEAGKMLKVSTSTVIRWIKFGYIQCTRTPGGKRQITIEEIEQMKKRCEENEEEYLERKRNESISN